MSNAVLDSAQTGHDKLNRCLISKDMEKLSDNMQHDVIYSHRWSFKSTRP